MKTITIERAQIGVIAIIVVLTFVLGFSFGF
jgi:hypothetical protein